MYWFVLTFFIDILMSLSTTESEFLKLYNCTTINDDPKKVFRYFCYNNLNIIRTFQLPDFDFNSIYESVLIEYRQFPHLEFLIRNAIIKLGSKWSYTIVCGNLNYDYMVDMCSRISPNIKIIKTDFDNLTPQLYSKFLSSLAFWDLLVGEKILIYQEDSIIFKNNIDDFMQWDYIGAPFPEWQDDTKSGVGNGGISLRTRSVMKQIINSITVENTVFNKWTLSYMYYAYGGMENAVPPEDVYFTKNMEDLNIGLLADRESAGRFSTESIVNLDSFAGHIFWLNDDNWLNRMCHLFF